MLPQSAARFGRMHTTQMQRFYASRYRWTLLCLVPLCILRADADAAEVAHSAQRNALAGQQFFCSTGYDLPSCLHDAARLKTVLAAYPSLPLDRWSWVIVRSQDWKPLLRRLRLDPRSPAFSSLEQRSTFLEEALFRTEPERAEELEQVFHMPPDELLRVAVAHEVAHASCHKMDERAANRVADRLLRGEALDCRAGDGPTPIQELFVHGQGPTLHR